MTQPTPIPTVTRVNRDNAAITRYLCDQGPARAHVVAEHRGDGLWRVESVVDPTVGFWHQFVDEKGVVAAAQHLRHQLADAARHEATARRLRRDALAYCRRQTTAMIDQALADIEVDP